MPPREGISIAHFLTVADIERSARYYEKVFGARILEFDRLIWPTLIV
jgi:predicted enzyme related to lactoylglutathione lyase